MCMSLFLVVCAMLAGISLASSSSDSSKSSSSSKDSSSSKKTKKRSSKRSSSSNSKDSSFKDSSSSKDSSSDSSDSIDLSDIVTSIDAQVFCDNYCSVYFNGQLVFDDQDGGRTVDEFTIGHVDAVGTRTFAVMLKDNPYSINQGIWQFESAEFLEGQTDEFGNPIVRQFCLGDGGFRAVFTDNICDDEVAVSSSEWVCETIVTGPRDVSACFPRWETDHTPVTFGGVNDSFILYDPCIRSSDSSFGLDEDNCDCAQDYNPNYVDFAADWFLPGFDDSSWVPATEYTEEEAVPKLGRSATQTWDECDKGQYCDRETYPVESWEDSKFIWSALIELDNVVVCRYEYTSTCGLDSLV